MKGKKRGKIISFLIAMVLIIVFVITGCGQKEKEKIIIYTSTEEYSVEFLQNMLNEKFPDYEIVVEYLTTGDHAAKLLSEGTLSEADITHDLEYGYLEKLEAAGVLADVSKISAPRFCAELVTSSFFYPEIRSGGAIIVNKEVLTERGLTMPTSYEDLLRPEYKGLISMPNPKSSGTGYIFLKSLVNAWGEEAAFAYFDSLSENILQFTSSGSGPVNALIQEEVAIGLGMTAQAALAISEGTDLEILFFEEGSPYTAYGQSIISGKDSRSCVVEVFDFLINIATIENCRLYHPEKLLEDEDFVMENFPQDIIYSDMSGNTYDEKERLLSMWKY